MAFELSFLEAHDFVSAKICGDFHPDLMRSALQVVRARAVETKSKRILIDATAVFAPETEYDRFRVGLVIVEIFGCSFKVAAFSMEESINKFMENAAVNRGARFRIFEKRDEAVEWLLGSSG